jgi:hypothetical protein
MAEDTLHPSLEHAECNHPRTCMVSEEALHTGGYGPDGPFVDVSGPAAPDLAALPLPLATLVAMRRQGGIHSPSNEELVYIGWRLREIADDTSDFTVHERLSTAAYLVQNAADR